MFHDVPSMYVYLEKLKETVEETLSFIIPSYNNLKHFYNKYF
jgi:hypothetical protein